MDTIQSQAEQKPDKTGVKIKNKKKKKKIFF